jgi:hypothetical protein
VLGAVGMLQANAAANSIWYRACRLSHQNASVGRYGY